MKADGIKTIKTFLSAFCLSATLSFASALLPTSAKAEDSHTPLQPIDCPGKRAEGDYAACFILHVPADWKDLSNRTMELPVMRFAPLGDKATKPPLLVLGGGPGQSVIHLEKQLAAGLKAFRQDRELILMDQRGTGPFAEHIRCGEALAEDQRIQIDPLVECVKQAEAEGYLRSDYSTDFAVQDYRALRYALKIDQWAILATSYGARVAQGLVAVDEKGIDRILFNGPLFTGTRFFDWKPFGRVEDALELCNEQDACRESYPDLLWDIERIPFELTKVKLPEEEPLPPALHAEQYRKRLQSLLSRHRLKDVPADVTKTLASLLEAKAQDKVWEPPSPLPQSMKRIGLMMHFSILCAEEIHRLADQKPDELSQPLRVLFYRSACEKLNAISNNGIKLKKGWYKAKKTKKPVLIINGALDTIVDPSAAKETLKLYPNGALFTVPFAGHDVISRVLCARKMMGQFLDGTKPSKMDNLCASRPETKFELKTSASSD